MAVPDLVERVALASEAPALPAETVRQLSHLPERLTETAPIIERELENATDHARRRLEPLEAQRAEARAATTSE